MSAAETPGAGAAGESVVLNRAGIEALLPHRARVRFEVLETQKRPVSAVADALEVRNVISVEVAQDSAISMVMLFDSGRNLDERILTEQFIEALAQTGAVCALSLPENSGKLALFAGIDKVRFKRLVRPGDTLRLQVDVIAMRAGVGRGSALATVDGQMACRGELMFALTDAAQTAQGQPTLSGGGAA